MPKSSKCLVIGLFLLAGLMFGFTFALVPIYNVFCQVTGLNGKIDPKHPGKLALYRIKNEASSKRRVIVEFDTNLNKGLHCQFSPTHTVLQVTPGELTHTSFQVKNLTNKKMIIQAIPSISPGFVAKHLKKLECFCFNQQTLNPGEALELPLRFWLEPEIPDNIHRLTLSYTLFDVTGRVKENAKENKT